MDGSQVSNPYLSGNFAPVASEDDFELEVVGEIPAAIRGAFYRNGPNPQFEPRGFYHWFTGDGMIHGVFVEDGKARYRNRYVRTPKWEVEHEAGKALFGGFDPRNADPSVAGQDGGVANTNIVWHAGKLMALEEAHPPFELDPLSLDSLGYNNDYRGRVTAHPKIDPDTGEMVWFAYNAGEGFFTKTVSYGVTDATGKVVRRDDFEAPFSSMVHDFMVTKNHALFPILPLTGDLARAMNGGPAFAWEPEKGSHVGVMRRDGDVADIRWFTTEACYVFHPMNAWEEGDKIIADVMEYGHAPLFPNTDGTMTPNTGAYLTRWTFDLSDASNTIKRERLDETPGEFPRFDERRAGLSYRHGWFAASASGQTGLKFDSIAHIDHAAGAKVMHTFGNGDAPGEPIFIPRSADAAEGDGWLIALVYRALEDRSDFVVLDALDIAKGPIAIAKLPRRVPFGFHGNWRAA
jgi:carotenoid cleavage dioxygenase-like enzyme